MEKKQIEVIVKDDLDWSWGISIERLKEEIKELEELGADTINIESEDSYGSAISKIYATQIRLETDIEFEKRVNSMKELENRVREQELKSLEQLKAKYEN